MREVLSDYTLTVMKQIIAGQIGTANNGTALTLSRRRRVGGVDSTSTVAAQDVWVTSGPAEIAFLGGPFQLAASQIAIYGPVTLNIQAGDTFTYGGFSWEVRTVAVPSDHDASTVAIAERE